MKSKLVLLFIAAVGSMALVASAQTPGRPDPITAHVPDGAQDVIVRAAKVPVPVMTQIAGYATVTAPDVPTKNTLFESGPYAVVLRVEEHNLSQQAERLARQLAESKSDGDREKIKGQLTEVLEKLFDQRQRRHEEEIKALEAQIKKLREMVEKRQENRRDIISRRLDQILKESQGLGW